MTGLPRSHPERSEGSAFFRSTRRSWLPVVQGSAKLLPFSYPDYNLRLHLTRHIFGVFLPSKPMKRAAPTDSLLTPSLPHQHILFRRGRNVFAIGRKGDSKDRSLALLQGLLQLAAGRPDAHCLVFTSRDYPISVRREFRPMHRSLVTGQRLEELPVGHRKDADLSVLARRYH